MEKLPKDPVMLMSVINMKLRDYNNSLDSLCEDMGIDKNQLTQKLKAAGFDYLPEVNQFR